MYEFQCTRLAVQNTELAPFYDQNIAFTPMDITFDPSNQFWSFRRESASTLQEQSGITTGKGNRQTLVDLWIFEDVLCNGGWIFVSFVIKWESLLAGKYAR